MTTRARAAPDRGGRPRALLAPRRRGRELGPPRARPARADAGRAATFFTVEAGTFENYLPDEATLAAVRRRAPRSNHRRGPSGGPAMADPLSPPDRAWSPRARGRPGVPLAGFGDLQLGVNGKEAPDVGGLGRHGLCLASRSMNSSLLVLALGGKARTSAQNRSGACTELIWPTPGRMISRDLGIAAQMASATSRGARTSWSP